MRTIVLMVAAVLSSMLVVLSLLPQSAEAQTPSRTQGEFEEWLKNLDVSKGTPFKVDVCVEGKWVTVNVSFVGDLSNREVTKTTTDCGPSYDANGNLLPSAGHARRKKGGGGGRKGSTNATAAARQATLAVEPANPSLRAIPFQPQYADSVYPTDVPCDASLNDAAYQVNHGTRSVTRITTCTGAKTIIPVTDNPLQLDITPDGTQVIVTSFDNAITFISTDTDKVTGVIRTGDDVNPSGIAISSDGTTAYVTSFNSDNPVVLVIDIAKRAIVKTISTTGYPQSVFLSPDDSLAWVTFPFQNAISIIDTLTGSVIRNVSAQAPFGVAFNSTGTTAYVTNGISPGTLQVIDTATYRNLRLVPVGNQPVDVLMAPDDAFLLVTNFLGQSLSLINPRTFETLTVPLKGKPRGLVLTR